MPGTFDTYGQVSPLAFNQDPSNQAEQQLDNMYLGMAFDYEEKKNAVLLDKQVKLDAMGKQLSAEHEMIKNTSFVKDKSILEEGFRQGIDRLKELYKTPGDKRDVEWFRLKDEYTKNVNSEAINNDMYNKSKYEQHYKAMQEGRVSVTDFYAWKEKFLVEAEQGLKTSVQDPPSAKENMFSTGMQVINEATWNPATDYDADGTTIKKESWKKMIDNRIIEQVYPDAHAKFLNLPEAERDKYYEMSGDKNHEYGNEEKTRSAIKQYIYEQFEGQRYRLTEQAYQQRLMSRARSTKEPDYSLYEETVKPYVDHIRKAGTDEYGNAIPEIRQTFKMLAPDLLTSVPRNMNVEKQEVDYTYGLKKNAKVYVSFRIPDGQSQYYDSFFATEKRRKSGAMVDVGWEGNEVRANILDEPIVLTETNIRNVTNNIQEFYDEEGNDITKTLSEPEKAEIRKATMQAYRQKTITDESKEFAFSGVSEPLYVIPKNVSKSNSFKHITKGIYDASLTTYNRYVTPNDGSAGITGF